MFNVFRREDDQYRDIVLSFKKSDELQLCLKRTTSTIVFTTCCCFRVVRTVGIYSNKTRLASASQHHDFGGTVCPSVSVKATTFF